MPKFKYIVKDKDGKTITGTIEANDRSEVVNILRQKELFIVSVSEPFIRSSILTYSISFKKKIKTDDLVIFSRQLATMVDAGIPLVGALDILGEQIDNKTFGVVIKQVHKDVEAGSSLSDAMSRHRTAFSALFVNMVRAGESSGTLDVILDRLATYEEKSSALQKKISSALVYPSVVSAMAVGITLLLLLKVIPVFKDIFSGFGAALPTPTLVMIAISDFLQKYFLVAVGAIMAIVFIINRYASTERGRFRIDSLLLKMPVFGPLMTKVAISKFTRTLSTLIKSGVPILAALEIVAKTAGNKAVEMAIDKVRMNVREGENIADPLGKSKIFPPMVVRMVAVGEQAGELEKMLSKIADFYDEQVDAAVSALTSLMEPFIIAFLGIVIGSIVICMFLPIFKITSVIGM